MKVIIFSDSSVVEKLEFIKSISLSSLISDNSTFSLPNETYIFLNTPSSLSANEISCFELSETFIPRVSLINSSQKDKLSNIV